MHLSQISYSKKTDEMYHIICKAINIDDERENYTQMYDLLTNKVLNFLRKDEHFNALFCNLSLCGSYADNLKISKPDEFDIVIQLKFPYNDRVELVKDPTNRGNVLIDLRHVLLTARRLNGGYMYEFLSKLVDEDNFLTIEKVHRWLESRFTKFILEMHHTLFHRNKEFKLKYRKQGPAHTIYVYNNMHTFSVDFVPGFRFDSQMSPTKRTLLAQHWEAIPKPDFTKNNNISYRTSYTYSERTLIKDKKQLKSSLRLMKKFRDKNSLTNLKSYYIKTLFLWQDDESLPDFWNRSITSIIQIMFEKLEEALYKREILFFWDDRLNLLDSLQPSQIYNMYHAVRNARKTLENATSAQQILNIFLTEQEQYEMNPKDKEIIQKTFMEQLEDNGINLLGFAALGAIGYGIYKWLSSRDDED